MDVLDTFITSHLKTKSFSDEDVVVRIRKSFFGRKYYVFVSNYRPLISLRFHDFLFHEAISKDHKDFFIGR